MANVLLWSSPPPTLKSILEISADALRLQGQPAQEMIDILHKLLNEGPDDPLSFHARRLLTKLVLETRRLPTTMMLQDVHRAVDQNGKLLDAMFGGGFADVYQGLYGNRLVAIKRLRPFHGDAQRREREFLKEVLVLCDLSHPYVVPFLGACNSVDGLGQSLCIVCPWFKNGTLRDFLTINVMSLDSDIYIRWVLEMAVGLEYLHFLPVPVVHGDLKAANILIDDNLCVRIADFGLSRLAQATETMTPTNGDSGTLYWKAPEMLQVHDENETPDGSDGNINMSCKTKATDIWAFGCTVYEIYEGRYPYHRLCRGKNTDDLIILGALIRQELPALTRPEHPTSRVTMPQSLWEILLLCWTVTSAKRPDILTIKSRVTGVFSEASRKNRDLARFIPKNSEQQSAQFPMSHKPTINERQGQNGLLNGKIQTPQTPHGHGSRGGVDAHSDNGIGTNRPGNAADPFKVTLLDDNYGDYGDYDHYPANTQTESYLRPDYSEADLLLGPDGMVRGGTLPALVKHLTTHELATKNSTFFKTFLITYSSFTDLDTFFNLLVERHQIQPPQDISPTQLEEWTKQQDIVRERVMNIFLHMVVDPDFLGKRDMYILDRIRKFFEISQIGPKWSQLKLALDRRNRLGERAFPKFAALPIQGNLPRSIVPRRTLTLLDIDSLELARQLTIRESNEFNNIHSAEYIHRLKESKCANDPQDDLARFIEKGNQISNWIKDAVLSSTDCRRRATIVQYFIEVADRCKTLNNFSCMFAFVAGLKSTPVLRLKRTWEQVNTKCMTLLALCETLLEYPRNFENYRKALSAVQPPCIPYIGLYLMELNSIREGSQALLNGSLINFAKRQRAAKTIAEIKHWQTRPYNLNTIPTIQAYIERALTRYGEDDQNDLDEGFWSLSLEREPHQRDDERMARLLHESGFL